MKDKDLIQKVQQAIKRLGTYILIKKGNNLTKGTLFNSKEWQTFKNSNIIEDIKQLFYHGKISLGIIIWRRHLIGKKLKKKIFFFFFFFLFLNFKYI